MLLEKDRLDLASVERENLIASYEEKVKKGRSAERLIGNSDWQRIKDSYSLEIERLEKSLPVYWEAAINDSDGSAEGDHKSCNMMRLIYAQIHSIRRLIDQAENEAKEGVEASKKLEELRGRV